MPNFGEHNINPAFLTAHVLSGTITLTNSTYCKNTCFTQDNRAIKELNVQLQRGTKCRTIFILRDEFSILLGYYLSTSQTVGSHHSSPFISVACKNLPGLQPQYHSSSFQSTKRSRLALQSHVLLDVSQNPSSLQHHLAVKLWNGPGRMRF